MAPHVGRHLEGGQRYKIDWTCMFYFWLCVTEHRKKNIEDENLDPSWRTVTTNMEGGLMIGCSKGEKVEEEKCDLAISPHFPIFRGSTTSYNGLCDHR